MASGVDASLAELAAAWQALPAEQRAEIAALGSQGCSAFAAALRRLGPSIVTMQAPALGLFVRGFQDVMIWGRDWEWLMGKVEHQFPSLVAHLKTLAPALQPGGADASR